MNQTIEQFYAEEDIIWKNDLAGDYLAEQFDPDLYHGEVEFLIHGRPEEETGFE